MSPRALRVTADVGGAVLAGFAIAFWLLSILGLP